MRQDRDACPRDDTLMNANHHSVRGRGAEGRVSKFKMDGSSSENSSGNGCIHERKRLTFSWKILSRDFGTTTSRNFTFIFFLTSFFIDSIHQLVAVEDHCKFSMKNGRENRNNGNQEEGEKEKETLSEVQ
jgi:hypothetical protein